MNANELLRAARARIEKLENWTQEMFARDKSGMMEEARSPTAVCWCAAGALEAALTFFDEADAEFVMANNVLARQMHGHIYTFNDNHTHSEVLAAFDRAIEATAQP